MSLAGSRFSSESALRPFHHGVRRRGGTISWAALPSDEQQVQADIRTHLIHCPAGTVAWTITPDGRCDFINRYYLETTGMTADHCQAPTEQWKKTPEISRRFSRACTLTIANTQPKYSGERYDRAG